ncbi:hypothetical protein VNI00_008663 [Paramarasmius palmivorus]|uniref:HNH nuclease domain-containing protein n=1 Tax=Paramarasmius palmivorus TaxID=297713 RepID=A0AAW0CVY1_9AGAR
MGNFSGLIQDAVVKPPAVYLEYHGCREKQGKIASNEDIGWLNLFRLRVIAAALCGFRCLLTLEPGRFNVDLNFCHLVAKTTNFVHLRRLEYALGLYPRTMFVDNYLNVIILRSDLHHVFDNGAFLIIPYLDLILTIKNYLERNSRHKLTKDKEKFYEVFREHQWEYRLFDINFDPRRAIQRKTLDLSQPIGGLDRFPDRSLYEECWPPFNSPECPLQHLWSHAHPLFMSFNAVMLLWRLDNETFNSLYHEHQDIRLLHEIGLMMNAVPPVEFFQIEEGEANEPPPTEDLNYLSPREAKYTQKAPAFKELIKEFEKARSDPFSMLPGQIIAPSARRRHQSHTPTTRVLRPRTPLDLAEDSDEGDDEITPKSPPPIPSAKRHRSPTTTDLPVSTRSRASLPTPPGTPSSERRCESPIDCSSYTSQQSILSRGSVPETPTKARRKASTLPGPSYSGPDEETEGLCRQKREAEEEFEWSHKQKRQRSELATLHKSQADGPTTPRRSPRNRLYSKAFGTSVIDGPKLPKTPSKRIPSSQTHFYLTRSTQSLPSILTPPPSASKSRTSSWSSSDARRQPRQLGSPNVQDASIPSTIPTTFIGHDFRNPMRIPVDDLPIDSPSPER